MLRRGWFLVMLPAVLLTAPAMAQGGWGFGGNLVPKTEKEKAYVEEANKLRLQIWQKQREIWALQAQEKPSETELKARQAELDALREKLCDLNYKNRELIWKMRDSAREAAAKEWYGRGRGAGAGIGPGGRGGRGGGFGARRGGWGGRGTGVCPWGVPVP